ncbi:hypothetical protein BHYA_0065g00220 [Botrytis hyacinthi]|uniref:Uncharacterized protein n=1 Tax=Botrytis hyacinthi TaxID=278943 RepID=A0A4Z1H029_9HELO|nr:hypothetical protein BHYA_0065g00220 [Botrytis hyacinthi]
MHTLRLRSVEERPDRGHGKKKPQCAVLCCLNTTSVKRNLSVDWTCTLLVVSIGLLGGIEVKSQLIKG